MLIAMHMKATVPTKRSGSEAVSVAIVRPADIVGRQAAVVKLVSVR